MDALSMGLVAAMGALATVAGASEDIESDVGSQSNPNSQVQLAAQVGNPHRIYNKAISGEPPANALWATTAAVVAYTLITKFAMPALFAIAVGASVAALFNGVFDQRLLRQERKPAQVQSVDLSGHSPLHDTIHNGTCMDNGILHNMYSVHTDTDFDATSSVPDACYRYDLGNSCWCDRFFCG